MARSNFRAMQAAREAIQAGEERAIQPCGITAWSVVEMLTYPEAVETLFDVRLDEPGAAASLPRLTSRSVPRYIAAVASGVAGGKIDRQTATSLLYAAQLMLSTKAKVSLGKVLGSKPHARSGS